MHSPGEPHTPSARDGRETRVAIDPPYDEKGRIKLLYDQLLGVLQTQWIDPENALRAETTGKTVHQAQIFFPQDGEPYMLTDDAVQFSTSLPQNELTLSNLSNVEFLVKDQAVFSACLVHIDGRYVPHYHTMQYIPDDLAAFGEILQRPEDEFFASPTGGMMSILPILGTEPHHLPKPLVSDRGDRVLHSYVVLDTPTQKASYNLELPFDEFTHESTINLITKWVEEAHGHEGFKQLIILLILLDENYRQGYFKLEWDRYLDKGYKRDKRGYHKTQNKNIAREVLQMFARIQYVTEFHRKVPKRGKDKKQEYEVVRLNSPLITLTETETYVKESDEELSFEEVRLNPDTVREGYYIHINKKFYEDVAGERKLYTKVWKRLSRLSSQKHYYEMKLAVYLADWFKIDTRAREAGVLVRTANDIVEKCGFRVDRAHRDRFIKRLEMACAFLKRERYILDFRMGTPDPWKDTWTFESSEEFRRSLGQENRVSRFFMLAEDGPPTALASADSSASPAPRRRRG